MIRLLTRITGVITLGLSSLFLVACEESKTESTAQSLPLVKTTALATTPQVLPENILMGTLHSITQLELGFQVKGKIASRLVEVGDTVAKGQVLARIDPKDLRLAVQIAKAAKESTQSQIDQAQADLARIQALLKKDLVSEQNVEQAKNQLTVLQKRLQAETEQLQQAQNQLDYTELKAPENGVVAQVLLAKGQVVASGQPVIQMVPEFGREIRVQLPQKRLAQEVESLHVTIKQTQYALSLAKIAPHAEKAHTWTAFLRFVNPAQLRASTTQIGQTYPVAFAADNKAVKVPISALYEQGDYASIWYIEDGMTRRRQVEVDQVDHNSAWITGDFSGIERIIAMGVHRLHLGQKVQEVQE